MKCVTRFSCAAAVLLASAVACSTSSAAILPFIGATFDPAPTGNIVNTTILTSYTTSAGTVTASALSHAVAADGNFEVPSTDITQVRNFWGDLGTEIDGVEAALNMDVSTGTLNAGDSNSPPNIDIGATGQNRARFFFSQGITTTVPGDGNDFFIVDVGIQAAEVVSIVPLDASGNVIGDGFVRNTTQFGDTGEVLLLDDDGTVDDFPAGVSGLAFDFDDLFTPAQLTALSVPLRGIAVRGSQGLDVAIMGVNDALAPLPVPEPMTSSLAVLAMGLCFATRRCLSSVRG